jgi:hypothetical protein
MDRSRLPLVLITLLALASGRAPPEHCSISASAHHPEERWISDVTLNLWESGLGCRSAGAVAADTLIHGARSGGLRESCTARWCSPGGFKVSRVRDEGYVL